MDINKIFSIEEDQIESYIESIGNESIGFESAFDEGNVFKRIWGKVITTKFFVGHATSCLNELKTLKKIDVKKIKDKSTEHSLNKLDLKTIEDAMDILEVSKGIPQRLQNHAVRAFEIIRDIDKKIYLAKDATDNIGKVLSPKLVMLNNIMKLCIMGYRVPVVADMYEIDTKEKAPFPMALYPLFDGVPKWLKKGFRKFNWYMFVFTMVNIGLGILATIIATVQTARVDQFLEDSDVRYLKSFYKLIYTDLSTVYKSVINRNGLSILDRLDEIISEKRRIPWEYEEKVKFAEYMKYNAQADIDSLEKTIKILNGKDYKIVARTTKALVSASFKLNSNTEDNERLEKLVQMVDANITIMYKVLDSYAKVVKEMRNF